jgi:hypothetical protein
VATFKVMFRPLVDKIPGFGERTARYIVTFKHMTRTRSCSRRYRLLVIEQHVDYVTFVCKCSGVVSCWPRQHVM